VAWVDLWLRRCGRRKAHGQKFTDRGYRETALEMGGDGAVAPAVEAREEMVGPGYVVEDLLAEDGWGTEFHFVAEAVPETHLH
jgi:hypothetical protein